MKVVDNSKIKTMFYEIIKNNSEKIGQEKEENIFIEIYLIILNKRFFV
jgi:hypothetical protein